MARLSSNSVFGTITGSIGGYIFGNHKGTPYVRKKAVNVSNPRTAAQLDQRAKFKTVIEFLKPLKSFLRIGFKSQTAKMSAFNAAMAYHLSHALMGSYLEYVIDYSKVLVSRGKLSGAKNPAASIINAGEIEFTWKDNRYAMANDMVMVVVYNPTKQEVVTIVGGTFRTEERLSIKIPLTFAGDEVYCYIAFQNARGTDASDSQFLGSLVVM